MENIKCKSENITIKSTDPKEKVFQPQSQEFNNFMNVLASIVEKHGAEILKELDCAV